MINLNEIKNDLVKKQEQLLLWDAEMHLAKEECTGTVLRIRNYFNENKISLKGLIEE